MDLQQELDCPHEGKNNITTDWCGEIVTPDTMPGPVTAITATVHPSSSVPTFLLVSGPSST
jgi:hypothetical protein